MQYKSLPTATIFLNIFKWANNLIKLSIALGCVIVIVYLLKIGYFPQGLSINFHLA